MICLLICISIEEPQVCSSMNLSPHLHRVMRLRTSGAISPPPCTPSWHEQGQRYLFFKTEGYMVVSWEFIIDITVKIHMVEHCYTPTNIWPEYCKYFWYYLYWCFYCDWLILNVRICRLRLHLIPLLMMVHIWLICYVRYSCIIFKYFGGIFNTLCIWWNCPWRIHRLSHKWQ
jgi:hypothetical protein